MTFKLIFSVLPNWFELKVWSFQQESTKKNARFWTYLLDFFIQLSIFWDFSTIFENAMSFILHINVNKKL